jgi:hypothetical protein
MNPIYIDVLEAVARWAISLAVTVLVTHHIITADQSASLTADLLHKVILYSPTLIPLGWVIWKIIRARVKMLVALMPNVHTEDQVNAIIKSGALTPTILTPPSTSPGVPLPQVKV